MALKGSIEPIDWGRMYRGSIATRSDGASEDLGEYIRNKIRGKKFRVYSRRKQEVGHMWRNVSTGRLENTFLLLSAASCPASPVTLFS